MPADAGITFGITKSGPEQGAGFRNSEEPFQTQEADRRIDFFLKNPLDRTESGRIGMFMPCGPGGAPQA